MKFANILIVCNPWSDFGRDWCTFEKIDNIKKLSKPFAQIIYGSCISDIYIYIYIIPFFRIHYIIFLSTRGIPSAYYLFTDIIYYYLHLYIIIIGHSNFAAAAGIFINNER